MYTRDLFCFSLTKSISFLTVVEEAPSRLSVSSSGAPPIVPLEDHLSFFRENSQPRDEAGFGGDRRASGLSAQGQNSPNAHGALATAKRSESVLAVSVRNETLSAQGIDKHRAWEEKVNPDKRLEDEIMGTSLRVHNKVL
jgi:hypothetical protein